MAQLTDSERQQLFNQFTSEASSIWEQLPLVKADLRATVDAIDDWVENNVASFNLAIPEPARTALTTKQKIKLLFMVIKRRWEVN